MKLTAKRCLMAAALAMVMFFGIVLWGSQTARAEGEVIDSGECGTSVTWTLTAEADGGYCLTIEASEEAATTGYNMNDSSRLPPWYDYQAEITKLVVGKNVSALGTQLMRGASSLETVIFEEGSCLNKINAGAFRDCTSLETIVFPDTLVTLGNNTFWCCEALRDVDLGSGVKTIGDTSFNNCVSLTTLHFGNGVTKIGTNAFSNVSGLEKVWFDGTWDEYLAMMTLSKVKDNVGCLANSDVEVIVSDGSSHYYGVSSVAATESDSVTSYLNASASILTLRGSGAMMDFAEDGSDAPWAGSTVKTVVIFDEVTRIGANAFASCGDSIETVIYYGTEESWGALIEASGDAVLPLIAEGVDIQFRLSGSCGDDTAYRMENNGDGTYTLIISGSGKVPGYSSRIYQPWYYASAVITDVVVEDGVTGIGSYVFDNLRVMTSITFASSVKMIDVYCLHNCVSLTSVSFPEGFENIGYSALNACTGLKEVYLPESLRAIDFRATRFCNSVTDVYYAGSRYSWENEIVIDNRYNDNGALTDANLHFGKGSVAEEDFTDITGSDPYYESIQYLYGRNLVYGMNGQFMPDLYLSSEEVIRALYRAAGADGQYESAAEWALENGLIDSADGYGVTADNLAELLMRTAKYNGYMPVSSAAALPENVSGQETEALLWCCEEGYLDEILQNEGALETSAVLTRAQGFSVLAAYLNSEVSLADRYEVICESLKSAISAGGDGKMYVTAVNINTEGLSTKVGDSTLIVLPDGKVMLLDSGVTGASGKLVQFLRDVGVKNLDYLVLSHCHPDHAGGFMNVLSYIYDEAGGCVGEFWFCGASTTNANVSAISTYLEGKGVSRTDLKVDETSGTAVPTVITLGDVTVTIFGPTQALIDTGEKSLSSEDINNTSLVMKFTYGESTYLTAGDIYIAVENSLIDTYGDQIQADIVKCSHHGYYQASGQNWVDAMHAQVAIAEINANGNYAVQQRYTGAGTAYYTTGYDGAVMVVMDNAKGYEVTAQYDSILRSDYTQEPNAVTAAAEQAVVSLEESFAYCGETVTFSVQTDTGYILESVVLRDCAGNEWVLTADADGIYSAVIPFCSCAVVVNTSAVTADIRVTVVWKDAESVTLPESVPVTLLAGNEEVLTVNVEESSEWTYLFVGLPVFSDGEQIVYSVTISDTDQYTVSVTGDSQNGFVIYLFWTEEETDPDESGSAGEETDPDESSSAGEETDPEESSPAGEETDPEETSPSVEETVSGGSSQNAGNDQSTESNQSPDTGDHTLSAGWILLAAVSLGVLVSLVMEKRKNIKNL